MRQRQDVTDTDVIIINEPILLRNIAELQDQNQRLRRVTRQLSGKMEKLEKVLEDIAEQVESEAVRQAKITIEGLHAKLKSQEAK